MDMLTPRQRGQEANQMTMYWAGADARKNLSLDDDDDPFDDAVPPGVAASHRSMSRTRVSRGAKKSKCGG